MEKQQINNGEIFDIEDSNEVAEEYIKMFGYTN